MASSWTTRYVTPYAVTPAAAHHVHRGVTPEAADMKSAIAGRENTTGNTSLRSKRPVGAA